MKKYLVSKYVGLTKMDLEIIRTGWETASFEGTLSTAARKMALTELEEIDALLVGVFTPAEEAAAEAGEDISGYTALQLIDLVEGYRGPIVDVEKVVKGSKELAQKGVNGTLSAVNKAANWVATKTAK